MHRVPTRGDEHSCAQRGEGGAIRGERVRRWGVLIGHGALHASLGLSDPVGEALLIHLALRLPAGLGLCHHRLEAKGRQRPAARKGSRVGRRLVLILVLVGGIRFVVLVLVQPHVHVGILHLLGLRGQHVLIVRVVALEHRHHERFRLGWVLAIFLLEAVLFRHPHLRAHVLIIIVIKI